MGVLTAGGMVAAVLVLVAGGPTIGYFIENHRTGVQFIAVTEYHTEDFTMPDMTSKQLPLPILLDDTQQFDVVAEVFEPEMVEDTRITDFRNDPLGAWFVPDDMLEDAVIFKQVVLV